MIYFSLFLLLFRFYKRFLSLSFIFLFTYWIVLFSSIKLLEFGLYNVKSEMGAIIFILCYVLPIVPIMFFKENKLIYLKVPIGDLIFKIFKIVCLGSIVSIFFYLPRVYTLLQGDLGLNRSEVSEDHSSFIIVAFNIVFAFFAICYPINIICFFYGITTNIKFYNKFKWLFLIGSFSYIFRVLAFVGRDGPVFWGFVFICIFAVFVPFMNVKHIANIKKGFLFFILIAGILLGLITISRFENYYDSIMLSVYDYIGQSFFNFSELFNSNMEPLGGILNFQLFSFDLISRDQFISITDSNRLVGWVFYGSLGSLYFDFGFWIFVLYLLFLPWLNFMVFKRKILNFNFLIYLIVLVHLFLHGIFYFTLKSLEGNLFLLFLFGLSVAPIKNYHLISKIL